MVVSFSSYFFFFSPQKFLFSGSTLAQGVTNDTGIHSSFTQTTIFILEKKLTLPSFTKSWWGLHTVEGKKIIIIKRLRNLSPLLVITMHNRFCGHRYEGNVRPYRGLYGARNAYICIRRMHGRGKKKSFLAPSSSFATCIMDIPEFKNDDRQYFVFVLIVRCILLTTRGYLWSSILFCGTTER